MTRNTKTACLFSLVALPMLPVFLAGILWELTVFWFGCGQQSARDIAKRIAE